MNFAIHGKALDEDNDSFVGDLLQLLKLHNANIFVSGSYFQSLKDFDLDIAGISIYDDTVPDDTDIVLSIGGDGTLLQAITHVRDNQTPLVGINTGRLGFLATVSKQEMIESIGLLLKGKYTIEDRMMVSLDIEDNIFGDLNFGLNEFSVLKQDTSSMIIIHAFLDGEFLNSYWSDGLIISTPTGSTGYSLSCGGPVVHPVTNSLIITPVSPHNLSTRPLIVHDNAIIDLKIESRSHYYLVSLDSRSKVIRNCAHIRVSKSGFSTKLVRFDKFSFVDTLRKKLHWGLDVRSNLK